MASRSLSASDRPGKQWKSLGVLSVGSPSTSSIARAKKSATLRGFTALARHYANIRDVTQYYAIRALGAKSRSCTLNCVRPRNCTVRVISQSSSRNQVQAIYSMK